MFFSLIVPVVSAIVMSFTRLADGGIAIMPCAVGGSEPRFTISEFTGGVSRYTGGESFAFYLNTTFNDYHSGCSGSISKGADDNGLQWCSTRVPGFNVSYVMTHDHKILVNHDYQCSLADGTVVDAHAEAAAALNVRTASNGRLSMAPDSQSLPAATKTH
ncbi:hypothetical protein F5Y17DRAFT_455015 [Xylariaceae sp. FL0594]|nr:hypothetical protein F5Y17DRAFT_455015 [Xylariaceae sp. FL0594]